MIKGTQKNVIILKNTKSPLFEEAYFILRERPGEKVHKGDMISEANRIISANVIHSNKYTDSKKSVKKEKTIGLILFILGALSGIAGCFIFGF